MKTNTNSSTAIEPASLSTFHFPVLDGLRGIAALIVVFSHTSFVGMYFLPYMDVSGTGRYGVFLFFVLSSFLLTTQLINIESGIFTKDTLTRYFQRRILRIYPLYTLYLLCALLSTLAITTVFDKHEVGIPFSLTVHEFLRHVFLMEGKEVTWSIAVEFKFYLVLPFLAGAFLITEKFGWFASTSLLVLLLVVSQVFSPQSETLPSDTRLHPYLPLFITGAYLAVFQKRFGESLQSDRVLQRVIKVGASFSVLVLILLIPSVYTTVNSELSSSEFRRSFIQISILWSLILVGVLNTDGLLKKYVSATVFRFFGSISFSLYLFHIVVIKLVSRFELDNILSAWLVLAISTLLAYFSFVLIERPASRLAFVKK